MAVYRFAELDSTQDEARRRIEGRRANVGDVITCDRQLAGRGRFGRYWISPSGGLYATFLVAVDSRLAVAAGVAAAETMRSLGLDLRLKWPNDLVIDERKLGGILIETIGGVALVGVGMNLEESPHAMATCARAHGVTCDRDALINALVIRFAAVPDMRIVDAYRSLSSTLGRRVQIERKGETLVGMAVDLDDEGRLIVERENERVIVASGDCFHLCNV